MVFLNLNIKMLLASVTKTIKLKPTSLMSINYFANTLTIKAKLGLR